MPSKAQNRRRTDAVKFMAVAVIVVFGLGFARPVRAADWTNGPIFCDVTDIELAPLWRFLSWGKWENFKVTFYLNKEPRPSITYVCNRDYDRRNNEYVCRNISTAMPRQWDWDFIERGAKYFAFDPGATKNQICDALFKTYRITPKNNGY